MPRALTFSKSGTMTSFGMKKPSNAKPSDTLPFPKGALAASDSKALITQSGSMLLVTANGFHDSRVGVGQ